MGGSSGRGITPARVVHWIARLLATLWFVFIAAEVISEGVPVGGFWPGGVRQFVAGLFFPIGFTAGYLLGWRWPLLGGCVSLACLVLLPVVMWATQGEVAPIEAWVPFAVLGVPGVLYVIAGWLLRGGKTPTPSQSST
jgi:hypothetical protein